MADVFKTTQIHGGSIRAGDMEMLIGDAAIKGHVVQQIQMQYQQQISTMYEIGSSYVYYVGGRAQGTLTIARVAGPSAAPGILFSKYGNICVPDELTLQKKSVGDCPSPLAGGAQFGGGEETYRMSGVIMTSVGISTTAQEVVINEQLGFQFLNLNMSAAGPD